jgi:cell division transport system permease protein
MISYWRIFLYGIQGFRRNVWLSVIAIITMTLTVVTVSAFGLGNLVAAKQYSQVKSKIDYNIFIEDSAADADVDLLRSAVEARPEVSFATYLDKDAVRKSFDTLLGQGDSTDLQGIVTADHNPLPREIDIKFKDANQIDSFNSFVKQDRFTKIIQRTSYQQNKSEITNFLRVVNFLRVFGIFFTVFFLVIAFLVILNTIRLAIYARREEVEVMRLVGATSGYIRGPFLVEGIFFGVVGALVASVLSWIFLRQLDKLLASTYADNSTNFISDLFSGTLSGITQSATFNSLFGYLVAAQLLLGLALGIICSYLAVRRYLKE